MRICQNPNCSNPFNAKDNRFCTSCGQSNFGDLLRTRFRILHLLGEGGFSRTYASQDADRLDAPCVIKQFLPQVQGTAARSKAAQLFKEEALRLYELGENHLQIPRLLAYFEQGSSLYLVQEFIEGETLYQELQKDIFSEEQVRDALLDLLPAIDFIHSHNVIHRDIKPENIIRRRSDRKLVLIDFGGAKQITQTSIARQATVIYTIGYAPAEQMAGFACHASDIYSLGVTCARLLTQCLPFHDALGNIQDPLYDAMNARWRWRDILQEKAIAVSPEFTAILEKMLKHVARERYQSAKEILRDLNTPQFNLPLTRQNSQNLLQVQAPTQPSFSSPFSNQSESKFQPDELEPDPIFVSLQNNFPPANPFSTNLHPNLKAFEFDIVTVDAQGFAIKRDRRQAQSYTEDLGHGAFLDMVLIPGGSFLMGSPEDEGDADERPQHLVSIESFFMGKYPVTQAQWKAIAALPPVNQSLNPNPSKFKGPNRPVENVSWHEVQEFCARLWKLTGHEYRLPSEAEWEYACRAGTTTPFHFGEALTPDYANCGGSETYLNDTRPRTRKETTPVGSFQVANAFGLYDMHGLVWEWCADPWHNNYVGAPNDGRVWEWDGDRNRRVLRGGSWSFSPILCRSASRSWNESDGGLRICGFRLVAPFDS